MRIALVSVAFVVACGGTPDDTIKIDSVTPNFAPLSGGTRVVIEGEGFFAAGAPPNRVVFGEIEAPLAAASDDGTLEVTVPPGEAPGEVPILVFNRNGTATATGVFHYSTLPAITSVAPEEVLFSAATTITVTGSGFVDEGAGVVDVLVNGVPAVDVEAVSDTQLTFTTLPGTPFVDAEIEILNRRGTATRERAYRFIPTATPALVIFTQSVTTFAVIYDPVNDVRIEIPNRSPNQAIGFRAVVRDPAGDFWGVDRNNNKLGRVDMTAQTLATDAIQLQTFPIAFVQDGDTTFGINRGNNQFGTFDLVSGSLAPISTNVLTRCCQGGTGLATNGTAMFYVNQQGISTVDKATGLRTGTTRLLSPSRHVRAIKFLGTTLFGVSAAGEVFTIDPATGTTTLVKALTIQPRGVELFTPKGLL